MTIALVLLNLILIYIGFKYSKKVFIFALCLLPFHAFLITWLSKILSLDSIQLVFLSFWKEAVLVGVSIALVSQIKNLKKVRFNFFDLLVALFLITAIIVSVFNHTDLKSFIWGVRYDFEIFWIYYIIKNLGFKKSDLKTLFSWLVPILLLISVFGILQFFVLPKEFLTIFGYGIGSWIPSSAIPAYQSIGDTQILRVQSFLAGPNQLGTFLLVAIFILITYFKDLTKTKIKKTFVISAISLSSLILLLTFSRSAILVFIFGLMLFLIYYLIKNQIWRIGITIALIVLFLIPSMFIKNFSMENQFVNNYILHQGSTTERAERCKVNYQVLKTNPFGLGLGSSGLAALRTKNDATLIPENWFMQIGIETGWIGLAIYILIVLYLLKSLFIKSRVDKKAQLAFIVLLSLSIHSLYLHTWSDSATVFWAWTVIGIAMSKTDLLIHQPLNMLNES